MKIPRITKLPHTRKPCIQCPFRKDTLEGWLGARRMTGILQDDSFICHKTDDRQCAGHMLLKGDKSQYVQVMRRLYGTPDPAGKELIFDTEQECIEHHGLDIN